jgi:hypothetical protein
MSWVGLMESNRIEINGTVFDLSDPSGKKAAVRAWLQARSLERKENSEAESPPETLPGSEAAEPSGHAIEDT